ncbi:MAG TPA: threonine/serine exporter family protein [Dongiaceae bacterium]|nr:threonine/serine exporter family protein [Dongiaceae bacterium]
MDFSHIIDLNNPIVRIVHNTVFGGLAAMGFGVLFNIGPRNLLWCLASGGLALAVRTVGLQLGWSLPLASFAAALAVGCSVQAVQERIGVSRNTLDVAGCIPMVPGGFAAKAILGFFALSAQHPLDPDSLLIGSVTNLLKVTFAIGAIGTGVAIPSLVQRVQGVKK